MHRFWEKVIAPLLDSAGAVTVMEIGVDAGDTTRLLLERAAQTEGGIVHAIDPAPRLDVEKWREEHGPRLRFHLERSHDALPPLNPVDAVLVDGDHNWFTVSGELEMLAATAAAHSLPLPLLIAHDVGWPYGRRDTYYNPDSIPDEERREAAQEGVLPGRSELSGDGVNPWLWNAVRCGGPRNGVLTAVEDFSTSYSPSCDLFVIEGFHGLGVLVSEDRLEAAPGLREAMARLRSAEFAHQWSRVIERARVEAEIQTWWAMGRPGPPGEGGAE